MTINRFATILTHALWLVVLAGVLSSPGVAQQTDDLVEVSTALNPAQGAVPGERVEVEITVATPRWFTAGTRISLPEVPDLVMVQNQDFAANATEQRSGVSWSIQRWSIDAFATRDGTLRIPPIDVTVAVSQSAAKEFRTTLKTDPLTLTIDLPESLKGLDHWVASPNVTLKQQVEGAGEAYLGSAITRHLTVKAQDVMPMFLPSLDHQRLDLLQTYPQPPVLRNSSNRGRLSAERKETTTWIASAPGSAMIPGVQINWWNTTTRRLEVLNTDSIQFDISGELPPRSLTWQQRLERLLPVLPWLGLAGIILTLALFGYLNRALRYVTAGLDSLYRQWRRWRKPLLADRLNPKGCAGETE